jgi:ankyrin repeat protein
MTVTTQRFTLDDYLTHDDSTDARYELVNGERVTMAQPKGRHGAIAEFLNDTFRDEIKRLGHEWTAKQMAVQFKKIELVQQALEHGADPNFSAAINTVPLAQAVSRNVDTESSRKLVQLLLDHGADVTHTWTSSEGQSYNALTTALLRDDLTIAQMLIDAGMKYSGSGDINLKGIGRSTDFTLLETLIEQGFDVNASERSLPSPLFQAVELGNMELARFLLSHGATLSADQHQWLLARASSPKQRIILALLSEQGVR